MLKPLSSVLAAVLCGCASLPPMFGRSSAREHLEFLTQATNATPAQRELMWREADSGLADEAQLHKALLQGIPGSARYDPAGAETALRALLAEDPPADVAVVARASVETLRCRAETEVLKKRLSKIADIERAADAPPKRP